MRSNRDSPGVESFVRQDCTIRSYSHTRNLHTSTSIIGLVVEFVVAIDEARVRFTDDAHLFLFSPNIHQHLQYPLGEVTIFISPTLCGCQIKVHGYALVWNNQTSNVPYSSFHRIWSAYHYPNVSMFTVQLCGTDVLR